MPAPGDQHLNHGGYAITNPFEEIRPRISEYTAQEIATLQSRLEKQLGPEYISSRPGPSGQKVHYVAAEKCIQLANEVFGFNGWSSSIVRLEVDFADEILPSGKYSVGIAVTVRVTIRDGTFHEDMGYGKCENKSKAAAFEKARKEATTDGLKRALRNFGNVLGNCIYDRDYLAKVTKVKVAPIKWDVNALHRHSDYVVVKKEVEAQPVEEAKRNGTASVSLGDSVDDEFGDFDEADFSVDHDPDPDSHPDEVALPFSVTSNSISISRLKNVTALGTDSIPDSPQPIKCRSSENHAQILPPRALAGNHALDAKGERNEPQHCSPQNQPQTPNAGSARSSSGVTAFAQTKPQDTNPTRSIQALPSGPRRPPNQPNRTGAPCVSVSPAPPQNLLLNNEWGDLGPALPQNIGSNTFFSARAAALLLDVNDSEKPPSAPGVLPLFNPHAESPSIRKTPGVDHNRSKPLNKELKHVPGSIQSTNAAAPIIRANIVNPQLDAARKIGAPGISSPIANRAMYKPPTMKRLNDGSNTSMRPPLGDKPANGNLSITNGRNEAKRQKLNGP